jgi:hypothetical protein
MNADIIFISVRYRTENIRFWYILLHSSYAATDQLEGYVCRIRPQDIVCQCPSCYSVCLQKPTTLQELACSTIDGEKTDRQTDRQTDISMDFFFGRYLNSIEFEAL